MSQTLPGDNPQAYIPADRRRALARGEDLPTRATGSALFVDISGFTPLTEALARELGERRGAEELSATLDRVFAALMEPLHAWRGNVVYFSGDAVTAWLDGDDGSRAAACGLAMQEVMGRVGTIAVPGGRAVDAGGQGRGGGRETCTASSSATRGSSSIDVLAGQLMDSLAAAEAAGGAGRRRPRRGRPGRAGRAGDPARGPAGRARTGRGGGDAGRPRRPRSIRLPTGPSSRRRSPASGCCRRCGSGWWPAVASSSPTSARRSRSSCASAGSTSRATPRRRRCSTTS